VPSASSSLTKAIPIHLCSRSIPANAHQGSACLFFSLLYGLCHGFLFAPFRAVCCSCALCAALLLQAACSVVGSRDQASGAGKSRPRPATYSRPMAACLPSGKQYLRMALLHRAAASAVFTNMPASSVSPPAACNANALTQGAHASFGRPRRLVPGQTFASTLLLSNVTCLSGEVLLMRAIRPNSFSCLCLRTTLSGHSCACCSTLALDTCDQ
jgi:hypothetical protein